MAYYLTTVLPDGLVFNQDGNSSRHFLGFTSSLVHRLFSLKCVNLFRKLITILVGALDSQPSGMSCRLETYDLRLSSSIISLLSEKEGSVWP